MCVYMCVCLSVQVCVCVSILYLSVSVSPSPSLPSVPFSPFFVGVRVSARVCMCMRVCVHVCVGERDRDTHTLPHNPLTSCLYHRT